MFMKGASGEDSSHQLRNIPSAITEVSESGFESRRASLNPDVPTPFFGMNSEGADTGGVLDQMVNFGLNKLSVDEHFPGLNLNFRAQESALILNEPAAPQQAKPIPQSLSVAQVSSRSNRRSFMDDIKEFFFKKKNSKQEESLNADAVTSADEPIQVPIKTPNFSSALDNIIEEENEGGDHQGGASAATTTPMIGFSPQVFVNGDAINNKKMSTDSTKANPLMMAMSVSKWKKIKSEEGKKQSMAVDESHQLFLDACKRRFQVELPRPIQLEVQKEAIQVVTHTVQLYKKQLGSKHYLTRQADEHLKMLWQEYADKSEITEAKQFIFF